MRAHPASSLHILLFASSLHGVLGSYVFFLMSLIISSVFHTFLFLLSGPGAGISQGPT